MASISSTCSFLSHSVIMDMSCRIRKVFWIGRYTHTASSQASSRHSNVTSTVMPLSLLSSALAWASNSSMPARYTYLNPSSSPEIPDTTKFCPQREHTVENPSCQSPASRRDANSSRVACFSASCRSLYSSL